jgi:UDP-N-acetylglucosamine 2-epimerase (non-hydrolysing)
MPNSSLSHLCVVFGTRPEAIKLAPVIAEIQRRGIFRLTVISSGQHKEMLDGILELWGIESDITLPTRGSVSHVSLIPQLMIDLEPHLKQLNPAVVIVQGDTATATATAILSHAMKIPVAHVEAGLRSFDIWNPWPEESNRCMIDALSSLHFPPTEGSALNLRNEGHTDTVHVTGNTVVDAIQHVSELLEHKPNIQHDLESQLEFSLAQPFILFTQHRREGFGDGQSKVFESILELAKRGNKIVFPVHLNPSVQNNAQRMLAGQEGIYLLPPQPYLPFVQLLQKCSLLISDSGGLQEEAPSFGKHIVITRKTTERSEVIDTGWGTLVGFDKQLIISAAITALENPDLTVAPNPFGDGQASSRILDHIIDFCTRHFADS